MSATNCNQLQAAMDVVVRDKNQALDQLDKVWKRVGRGREGRERSVSCVGAPGHSYYSSSSDAQVRLLVRERLGEASLIGGSGVASKARKKRAPRRSSRTNTSISASVTGGGDGGTDGGGGGGSTISGAYTYGTATTFRTKLSQPDHVRMPSEYEKAIEFLKKREEKGAMILATNELGDVHAHFGEWGGATTAWNDALDALIGPYQVHGRERRG